MPSMSNLYAYLAPLTNCDEDVRRHCLDLANEIEELVGGCEGHGLRRGLHFTLKPLTQTEVDEVIQDRTYPARVPLCEIRFRNRKCFEVFRASGLAEEIDEPI